MSANPLPWFIIASVVLLMLAMKGHLKFPAFPHAASPSPSASAVNALDALVSRPDVNELAKLGSYALGIAFAKSIRAEAETALAHKIAQEAGEAIHAKFTDPFSPPGQAGQDHPPVAPPSP